MFDQIKTVLILSPHPDDAEFGLGGTLVKLLELGKEVHLMVFSKCEKSTPEGFEVGTIEGELQKSCMYLGIKNITILDHEVREFPRLRQEILEDMVSMNDLIKPDLVFLPGSSDIHQDHNTIYQEGIRAFKFCNVLGYEMPWNNSSFKSYVYIGLTRAQLDRKVGAIECYKSQSNRPYAGREFIHALATIRGVQVRKEYAESFEMIRWIE